MSLDLTNCGRSCELESAERGTMSKRARLMITVGSGIAVLVLHGALFAITNGEGIPGKRLEVYVSEHLIFMGASYGLAASLAAFGIATVVEGRKRGLVGAAGGVTVGGVLYFAACFLMGCCGSPMLAVYVALLGPRAAGLGMPIVFCLTLASVAVGFILIGRRRPCKNCEPEGVCSDDGSGKDRY